MKGVTLVPNFLANSGSITTTFDFVNKNSKANINKVIRSRKVTKKNVDGIEMNKGAFYKIKIATKNLNPKDKIKISFANSSYGKDVVAPDRRSGVLDADAAEGAVRARRRRAALALVVRVRRARAVGGLRRTGQAEETQLANPHSQQRSRTR